MRGIFVFKKIFFINNTYVIDTFVLYFYFSDFFQFVSF